MLIEFCQKPNSLNDLHINSGDSWKVVVLILQTWLAGFLPLNSFPAFKYSSQSVC